MRLSYPDWIIDRLADDLGVEVATASLEAMNERPQVTRRADGYIQDLASQWVADLVEPADGPVGVRCGCRAWRQGHGDGRGGAVVVAGDRRQSRVGLLDREPDETRARQHAAAAGRRSAATVPSAARSTGCCSMRRVPALARCAAGLTHGGASTPATSITSGTCNAGSSTGLVGLVKPGGMFVYSVCTMTHAETVAIDEHLERKHPSLVVLAPPSSPWEPMGRGAMLLPQAADTDGMYILRVRVPG